MTFEKGNIGYFLAFVLIGAILGSAIGTLLVNVIPALSILNRNLTGPIGFNLEIISFQIKLNLSSIIGIVSGIIIFKKI
jgi:hypothetical protein